MSNEPVVRRDARLRFLAPDPAPAEVVVSRGVFADRDTSRKSQLSRQRNVAGDLPAWDLMPPHELLV